MMSLKRGCKDTQVLSIQEILVALGFMAEDWGDGLRVESIAVDGDFGPQTEAAVVAFQKEEGLFADGIVGPATMQALQDAYMRRQLELTSPTADAAAGLPERYRLVRVAADRYLQGYSHLLLRSDAAEEYQKVAEAVHEAGGILTSSGGIRSLDDHGGINRSRCSLHYVGLALDLFVYSGMVDPKTDPYVITRRDPEDLEASYFQVWARCDPARARKDVALPAKTLKCAVTYAKRGLRSESTEPDTEGCFLDLTSVFQKHGFRPIKPRPSFGKGGSIMSAEWWHFQYEKPLVPGVSTFGGELLKLYSRSSLEGKGPWAERDRLFGINWCCAEPSPGGS
ncbi:MAG: peptidoglycan-binding domain-containing protein [Acidobacteriota bacterium]